MKKYFILLMAFSLLLLSACSVVTVKTDYDHSEDFSKYKTFKLYDGDKQGGNALVRYPELKKQIDVIVKETLQDKGLSYKESGEADLIVNVHATLTDKTQLTDMGGARGGYSTWWGPYGSRTMVSYYTEGNLVIDLVDSAQKELSWRGIGTKVVDGSAQNDTKKLRKIITEIMKNYPPKTQ